MTEPELNQALKRLRLSGIQATLETRSIQAAQGKMTFIEAFSALIQDEMDRRQSKWIERQFTLSGIKEKKALSDFDWLFNPRLPKSTILELMTLKFIHNHEDALLIGHPGTGKSHVAKSICSAAIQTGFRVLYREAHVFFEDLHQAEVTGNRKKWMKAFSESDLLVIDDLALRKLPIDAGERLLEVVMNRYEKKSTIITSNRVLEDWGKVLGDQTVSSAILDRLLHHGHLLRFEGKSYRLKEAAERSSGKVAKTPKKD